MEELSRIRKKGTTSTHESPSERAKPRCDIKCALGRQVISRTLNKRACHNSVVGLEDDIEPPKDHSYCQ